MKELVILDEASMESNAMICLETMYYLDQPKYIWWCIDSREPRRTFCGKHIPVLLGKVSDSLDAVTEDLEKWVQSLDDWAAKDPDNLEPEKYSVTEFSLDKLKFLIQFVKVNPSAWLDLLKDISPDTNSLTNTPKD